MIKKMILFYKVAFMSAVFSLMNITSLKAQTNSSDPHVICVGSTEPYQVDYTENGGQGTTGSIYSWSITSGSFTGTIATNQGPSGSSNRIEINWGTSLAGNYILQVIETNIGCPGTPIELNITLEDNATPAFVAIGPLCQNSTAPLLAITSTNGITGTWSPATISTVTTGTTTYTFTPDGGQCAIATTMDINIDTGITPTFDAIGPFCLNSTPTALPTTSLNGITGTWSPATIATYTQGTSSYTFTPDAGQCAVAETIDITVNDNPVIVVSSPTICDGETTSLTASGATNYTWSPATGLSATTGTTVDASPTTTTVYTVTGEDGNGCSGTASSTVTVNPAPNTSPIFHD